MSITNQSIDSKLVQANLAISNALSDTEILPMLTVFSYDEVKIGEGKTLYETASELHLKQKNEYSEQFAATNELETKFAEANKAYMRHVKIARIALKDNHSAYLALGLSGERKQSLSGWLSQAMQFYKNAIAGSEVQTALAKYGVTLEKLEADKELAAGVETAKVMQQKETGEAQQATLDRDNAVDALDEWMSDFISIARIALEERPQLLEKLGIVEKS